MLPLLLLEYLALFYHTEDILVCLEQEEDFEKGLLVGQAGQTALPILVMSGQRFLSSEGPQSTTRDSRLFAHCQHDNISAEFLEPNSAWISDSVFLDLPFRLDTNFVTYVVEGGSLKLWEHFKIKGGKLVQVYLGHWSNEKGLQVEQNEKWERRSDLHGVVLTNELLPWTTWNIAGKEKGGMIGLFPDVLHILENMLNFSQLITHPADGQFGSEAEDGYWTGIVGDLSNNLADFSSAGLSVLLKRQRVVDYSITLLEDTFVLYQLSFQGLVSTSLSITAYLNIFQGMVWLASFVAIGAVIGVAALGDLKVDRDRQEPYGPFLMGIWFPTAGSSSTEAVQKRSTRVLFLAATFLTYMLITCYCVDLIAHMTVGQSNMLTNCEEAEKNGATIFVRSGAAVSGLFSESGIFSTCQKSVSFVQAGCDMACAIETLKSQTASSYFYSSEMINSDLALVTSFPSVRSPLSWCFRKNSELVRLFNHHLLGLLQSGTYARLHYKWVGKYRNLYGNGEAKSSVSPIPLNHLYFPMSVMLVGVVGSFAVAFLEKLPSPMCFARNVARKDLAQQRQ